MHDSHIRAYKAAMIAARRVYKAFRPDCKRLRDLVVTVRPLSIGDNLWVKGD